MFHRVGVGVGVGVGLLLAIFLIFGNPWKISARNVEKWTSVLQIPNYEVKDDLDTGLFQESGLISKNDRQKVGIEDYRRVFKNEETFLQNFKSYGKPTGNRIKRAAPRKLPPRGPNGRFITTKTPAKSTSKTPAKKLPPRGPNGRFIATKTPRKLPPRGPNGRFVKTKTPPKSASKTPPKSASKTPPKSASKTPPKSASKTPAKKLPPRGPNGRFITTKTPAKSTSKTPAKKLPPRGPNGRFIATKTPRKLPPRGPNGRFITTKTPPNTGNTRFGDEESSSSLTITSDDPKIQERIKKGPSKKDGPGKNYAYTSNDPEHSGRVKIGETSRKNVEERTNESLRTNRRKLNNPSLEYKKEHETDSPFRKYSEKIAHDSLGGRKSPIPGTDGGTEVFEASPKKAKKAMERGVKYAKQAEDQRKNNNTNTDHRE